MQQAQRFGKSGGSVLRMTVFRKFEVCASYESLVVKSPPSPSRKTLYATLGRHDNERTNRKNIAN